MSRFSDQIILAYVDGELDPKWVTELEAAMDADPALAERVARHAELRATAGQAFASVLREPAPERLLSAVGIERPAKPAKVVRPRFGAPRGFGLPQWAAMAACLVVGVLVGRAPMIEEGPVKSVAGGLEARGELVAALDGKLAADPGPIRVGLSFRDNAGAYCRTFQMDAEALAGVACRNGEGWDLRMTARFNAQAASDYRMAASATPPAVLAYVDSAMAGAPLDRGQEIAARKTGWR